MMTVSDLEARVRRLEQLTRGLAKEVVRWKEGNDPLLYLERKAYRECYRPGWRGWTRPVQCWRRRGGGWWMGPVSRLNVPHALASGGRQPPD